MDSWLMEKKRLMVKDFTSTAYLRTKEIARSISEETKFQFSTLRKTTEPLRNELKLMAADHMQVVRKHSEPIVNATKLAISEQIRATKERHRKAA